MDQTVDIRELNERIENNSSFVNMITAFKGARPDLVAREKMADASCLAGVGFANAFLGINHSLSHKLGGWIHIPHGTANALLCRAAADATGLPVHAGPAEATALGNILVAACGAGLIDGDLAELRRMVWASSEIVEYAPDPAAAPAWEAAERRLFG